jgi:hypothetical protein
MSLDVSLNGKTYNVPCTCRECGHEHEREETENFFSANITHNLGGMAEAAGIYKHLWRPEEIGITKAEQLIEPLKDGIALMESDPERFKKFNAPNGWGMYEHFMPWLREYLAACKKYPNATIEVSR